MNNSTWNSLDYIEKLIIEKPFGWELSEESKQGLSHFRFEEIDQLYWKRVLETNWTWAFYASGVYLGTIYGLQRWMKGRPAYDLRMALFLWNASIGLFSILGFSRMAPGFFKTLFQSGGGGFYRSFCEKKGGDIQTMYWLLAFILSKYFELIDTVFLVLRKKPVIFLQWYHHMVTMIVCWNVAPFIEPVVRWFSVINFGVHSLMYPYFAVRALGMKTPVFVPNFITTIQFVQMVIGLVVNILSIYYYNAGQDCYRHPHSVKMFTVIYTSFLFLFGKLFYDSVVAKGRSQREKQKMKKIY